MGKANFDEDFKRDAVFQITARGHLVAEAAVRLGSANIRSTSGRSATKGRVLAHSDQGGQFTSIE
jgi:transposase